MEHCLFLFQKDLRMEDNKGLQKALESGKKVIPCFVFEHGVSYSPYFLQFMLESIVDLQKSLKEKGAKLYLFYGKPEKVVEKLVKEQNVTEVFVNRSYLPKSHVKLKHLGISIHEIDDALLNPPEETLKKDGKPYTIFTPYFKNCSKIAVEPPKKMVKKNYFCQPIGFENGAEFMDTLPRIKNIIQGGRDEALKILKNLSDFKAYATKRDFPAEDYTTHLSAYLNFGCISIREVYAKIEDQLGTDHELIRALYWRDFFTHIGYFFPHVFKGAFHEKFDKLKWGYDKDKLKAWKSGKTGFPIVDAGMRELNETGCMHNRVRMIVASFLTKDLHIDWREGEKYFAEKLIDYDPAINNGNWQWAASTGCDAQPYFRIFNPWNQQKKFDPDCIYIKKWVKELQKFSSKQIHNGSASDPIVDHTTESKLSLKIYKSVRS